jgi:hypothetical protein
LPASIDPIYAKKIAAQKRNEEGDRGSASSNGSMSKRHGVVLQTGMRALGAAAVLREAAGADVAVL